MPDVAAFDFDGTLTTGGSVFDFLVAATDRATVTAAAVALAPRLARAAVVGGAFADSTKELLFTRVLAGVALEHVQSVAHTFAEQHVAATLRSDVLGRLKWHRARGDRVVIVSASPECYVREAGVLLGVDAVIATRLEVGPDAMLTGHYLGRNCRGEEKLRRLSAWIADPDAAAAGSTSSALTVVASSLTAAPHSGGPEATASAPATPATRTASAAPTATGTTCAAPAAGTPAPAAGTPAPTAGTPAPTAHMVVGAGPQPRLWAYGNSRGDLRMLTAADVGVNVGRLGAFGRLRGFPTLANAPTA